MVEPERFFSWVASLFCFLCGYELLKADEPSNVGPSVDQRRSRENLLKLYFQVAKGKELAKAEVL